jgi:NADH:ubiquinone oxidoreductase subunit 4 (subunit M)
MVQRAFLGPNTHGWSIDDLSPREGAIVAVMMIGLLWLGLYPKPVIDLFGPVMDNLQHQVDLGAMASRR